jgi:hypothetical protein
MRPNPRYGGEHCEAFDAVDDCATVRLAQCSGHGTCTNAYLGVQCTCYAGYGDTTRGGGMSGSLPHSRGGHTHRIK